MQHVQYMLLFLALAVNSDWFQILQSYTLLLYLPILMRSCCITTMAKYSEARLGSHSSSWLTLASPEDCLQVPSLICDSATTPVVGGHQEFIRDTHI